MALPIAITAISVGSALVSAFQGFQAKNAQAKALRQQARIGLMRSEEILARNEINNEQLRKSAIATTQVQAVQTAGSGKTQASTRSVVEATMQKAGEQMKLNTRAAQWESRMAQLGAQSEMSSAKSIQSAAPINAMTQLGTSLTNLYIAKGQAPKGD